MGIPGGECLMAGLFWPEIRYALRGSLGLWRIVVPYGVNVHSAEN
jgi:hypothetical protein